MKNRKANIPVIGVEGIAEYVESSNEIRNRHFVYLPDGSQFFCIKGEMIPADEKPSALIKKGRSKGKNLDGRNNWIEQ